MKKKIIFLMLLVLINTMFTACSRNKANPNMEKAGLGKEKIQRINIVNSRSNQKYTFSQERSKERFQNIVLRAVEVTEDTKLDPDFIFDFYSETKKLGSFKYIAGIDNKDVANLIDEENRLYHIDSSIENEFFKRMIKARQDDFVPQYYTSLVQKILEKLPPKANTQVVVDIRKDTMVTGSLISVNQKRILDNITKSGFEVKYPGEIEKPDYFITVTTKSYNASKKIADAVVSVTDVNNVKIGFSVKLTQDGNFHIVLQ